MADECLSAIERDYPDYLRDESRRVGTATSISFPTTQADVVTQLAEAKAKGSSVTIQGARTGITGGATPNGGHVLNLSRMTRVTGLRYDSDSETFFLTVEPGLLLSELRQALASRAFDTAGWTPESLDALNALKEADPLFFPPDPTETGASIGGMAACNASGARAFLYGSTRPYIERLVVVLADGATLELRRGVHKAQGRAFSLKTHAGKIYEGALPSAARPAVKSAAGFFAEDDMDLIDLFIGSEGALGVVTEIDIRLLPAPQALWGIVAFFPSEKQAIAFVLKLRENRAGDGAPARLAAIEFFDSHALALLREQKAANPTFKDIPDMPPEWDTAVFVEYHGTDEASVETAVMEMSDRMAACGGDESATWIASDKRELERLKDFRHAAPEAVNLLIDERRKTEPGLAKLGTDLAVPDAALEETLALYHKSLDDSGLDFVMFGHIGDNHLHVNIIPKTLDDYNRGKRLHLEWARAGVRMGGTVSAEHGIGKLKTALLEEMVGRRGIEEMKAVKKVFDPEGILNPGNLFAEA